MFWNNFQKKDILLHGHTHKASTMAISWKAVQNWVQSNGWNVQPNLRHKHTNPVIWHIKEGEHFYFKNI